MSALTFITVFAAAAAAKKVSKVPVPVPVAEPVWVVTRKPGGGKSVKREER